MIRDDFYGRKFDMIQVLRGVAIVFVMLEHIALCGFGAFGVDVFFVISGFMAMYSTCDRKKLGGASFLIGRFLRIAPLYYVMTLITFAGVFFFPGMFRSTDANPVYLIKSLLFIPYEIQGQCMPIVRVGWCLNFEMFFYLLFFISFKISHKFRGLICSAAMLVMVAVGQFVSFSFVPLKFWFSDNLAEFVLGIAAFYICKKLYPFFVSCRDKKGLRTALITLCSVLSASLFVFMKMSSGLLGTMKMARFLVWGIPSFFVFILFFWAGCMIDVKKAFMFVGNISFSLFLIHYYPVMLMNRVGERFESLAVRILLTLCGVAIAFAVSIPVNLVFEKKIVGFFKKI